MIVITYLRYPVFFRSYICNHASLCSLRYSQTRHAVVHRLRDAHKHCGPPSFLTLYADKSTHRMCKAIYYRKPQPYTARTSVSSLIRLIQRVRQLFYIHTRHSLSCIGDLYIQICSVLSFRCRYLHIQSALLGKLNSIRDKMKEYLGDAEKENITMDLKVQEAVDFLVAEAKLV